MTSIGSSPTASVNVDIADINSFYSVNFDIKDCPYGNTVYADYTVNILF